MKNIIDVNNYTSEAMPVTHKLIGELKQGMWSTTSNVVQQHYKNNEIAQKFYQKFRSTPTQEQKDLLDVIEHNSGSEMDIVENEHFAKGLKLGFRLAMELLG